MDAYSSFLARKLSEMIKEKREEYLRPLLQGRAADYPDYKARAAYLQALADVEEWLDQINAEEDKDGRGPFARAS